MPRHKKDIETIVLEFIKEHPDCHSKDILKVAKKDIGSTTLKLLLHRMFRENLISVIGKGKNTKYQISPGYELLHNISVREYFKKEIDDRKIRDSFNYELINTTLHNTPLFSEKEYKHLINLQDEYKQNASVLTPTEYKKELERLAIDLIWKSSQIEGNTYSLLETERLIKEQEETTGKTRDEATMILNHKAALDFIIANRTFINPLTICAIEDIHSLLIKDLRVDRNIRIGRVGISGTNYKPLDNEHQIREALQDLCNLINGQKDVFSKALLALLVISYIQPFADGNKRTARIISNAILMNNEYCPISFRTVDTIEYKQAMLIFYEQNNISAFKNIFIDQFAFAVETYF